MMTIILKSYDWIDSISSIGVLKLRKKCCICEQVNFKGLYMWTSVPSLLITVCVLAAQSCPTPCSPMDYSPPGSSVHDISQARIPEWLPFLLQVHHYIYRLFAHCPFRILDLCSPSIFFFLNHIIKKFLLEVYWWQSQVCVNCVALVLKDSFVGYIIQLIDAFSQCCFSMVFPTFWLLVLLLRRLILRILSFFSGCFWDILVLVFYCGMSKSGFIFIYPTWYGSEYVICLISSGNWLALFSSDAAFLWSLSSPEVQWGDAPL